jgi:hypothetical protein
MEHGKGIKREKEKGKKYQLRTRRCACMYYYPDNLCRLYNIIIITHNSRSKVVVTEKVVSWLTMIIIVQLFLCHIKIIDILQFTYLHIRLHFMYSSPLQLHRWLFYFGLLLGVCNLLGYTRKPIIIAIHTWDRTCMDNVVINF